MAAQGENNPKLFLTELIGNELAIKIDREKYPDSVFYFKGSTCLFELEKSDGTTYLWCNYFKIWNPISVEFSLGYAEIKILIKETLEDHFKMRDVKPGIISWTMYSLMDDTHRSSHKDRNKTLN